MDPQRPFIHKRPFIHYSYPSVGSRPCGCSGEPHRLLALLLYQHQGRAQHRVPAVAAEGAGVQAGGGEAALQHG
eukprot:7733856-Pyramimonas_sp.AAC.4